MARPSSVNSATSTIASSPSSRASRPCRAYTVPASSPAPITAGIQPCARASASHGSIAPGHASGSPSGITGGQRHPADHAVRDGRLAGRGPHDALLPAQREVPERVPLAVPLKERPQPPLVVLGERVDGTPGAEGGVEDGEDQGRAEHVDGDVRPVGRRDPGEAGVVGGDGDQPQGAVLPAVGEGRGASGAWLVTVTRSAASSEDTSRPPTATAAASFGLDRSPFA